MKMWEQKFLVEIMKKQFCILRVDGKAFHTYTKRFQNRFSLDMIKAMNDTAKELLCKVQGSLLVYVQSDEISVLFSDTSSPNAEAWYGNNMQKIASVGASIATATFNGSIAKAFYNAPEICDTPALFDARVFSMPEDDLPNYFLWRMRDANSNALQSFARQYFSHKELQNVDNDGLRQMLLLDAGISYTEGLGERERLGAVFIKKLKDVITDEGDLLSRKVIEEIKLENNCYVNWKNVIDSSIFNSQQLQHKTK